MARPELVATERTVLGKKVRFLRRQGLVPANLFGKGKPSLALQLDTAAMRQLTTHTERNVLVSLSVDGDQKPHLVLLREVQRDPTTAQLLHAAFYEVDMTTELRLEVPVVFKGESPAVARERGTVVRVLNTVAVQCLPVDIPAHLEVDLTPLAALEQALYVKDIPVPPGVRLLNDPELMVVKVQAPALVVEEAKPAEAEAEAKEGEEEAAATSEQ